MEKGARAAPFFLLSHFGTAYTHYTVVQLDA